MGDFSSGVPLTAMVEVDIRGPDAPNAPRVRSDTGMVGDAENLEEDGEGGVSGEGRSEGRTSSSIPLSGSSSRR